MFKLPAIALTREHDGTARPWSVSAFGARPVGLVDDAVAVIGQQAFRAQRLGLLSGQKPAGSLLAQSTGARRSVQGASGNGSSPNAMNTPKNSTHERSTGRSHCIFTSCQ